MAGWSNEDFQKFLESDVIKEGVIKKFKDKDWNRLLDESTTLYNWPIQNQLVRLDKVVKENNRLNGHFTTVCQSNGTNKNSPLNLHALLELNGIVPKTLGMRALLQAVLKSGLDRDDRNTLAVWIIRDWGGIQSGKKPTKATNPGGGQPDTEDIQADAKLFDLLDKADEKASNGKFDFDRIASWSKFIAFKYPQTHGVYDARVVYSLNWLLLKAGSKFFFPFLDGQNSVLSLLDYRTQIFLTHLGKKEFKKKLDEDINSRKQNPGKKSYIKSELEQGLFLDKKSAYWNYSLLLRQLANQVCPKDQAHGVTRMEMILFSIADKDIAEEVMNSLVAAK